jgi:isoleucyl-tRNA synthetase
MALMQRQKEGIPVRQPLSKLLIKHSSDIEIPFWEEMIPIICDETNIREVVLSKELKQDDSPFVIIDTNITPELKEEGSYRELVRAIQDLRKKSGLNPSDIINLEVDTDTNGQNLINKFENEIKKIVNADSISFKKNTGEEIKIAEFIFKIKF